MCSARTAESGPIVTATTSSTGIAPPSLICMAASMACVSKGLRFFSPLRSSRIVFGSMRFWTAASGTSLTRTQIFKLSLLGETILSGPTTADENVGILDVDVSAALLAALDQVAFDDQADSSTSTSTTSAVPPLSLASNALRRPMMMPGSLT